MEAFASRTATLYLDEQPREGPMNMAIDEALLRLSPGLAIRFYHWREPTLSLGYFQPCAIASAQQKNLPVVRRWTGGGLVSHGNGDQTFSVISPRGEALAQMKPDASYAFIHHGIVSAFAGSNLRLAACADTLTGSACFQSPALHDVLRGSTKIAGGAQRRTRAGFLHQGSIQQMEIPPDFPARFARHFAKDIRIMSLPLNILDAASRLVAERYGSPQWLTKF